MSSHYDRRKLLKTLGAGVMTTVPLAGCSGGGSESTPTATTTPTETESGGGGWTKTSTVDMTNALKFKPKKIQVSQGTTVTWKNTGTIGHTVTAYGDKIPDGATYFASGGFDSEQAARKGYKNGQKGVIGKGEMYKHTFETTGQYKYFCIPHEMNGMIGYVKVV